jgi:hypothetical protein
MGYALLCRRMNRAMIRMPPTIPCIIIVRADLLDRIVDIPFSVQTTHWLSCGRGLVLCFAFRSAIPNSILN